MLAGGLKRGKERGLLRFGARLADNSKPFGLRRKQVCRLAQ